MEVVGAIVGAVCTCLSNDATKCWKHHKNIKKNWNALQVESGKLNSRKTDIIKKLEVDVKPGVTEKRDEVSHWLERVEKINQEIKDMEEKVEGVKFYARARRGEEVVEMIAKVEKLYKEGSEFPDGDLVREIPQRGSELPPTAILEGETSTHEKRKKILACLLDERVSKIGVYGMGGIGKTTAFEYINNYLLVEETNKFDKVIFVTVSKASNVKALQDKIASRLMLDMSKYDEDERAEKLYEKLKECKKFLLILDDMWEAYPLKDLGIPEPTSENGCKLVLTTRSRNVCSMMSCEPIIQMGLLSEDEALNLFREKVGNRVSSNPILGEMVNQVAQECACLPLAIITVAGFLRDKEDPCYWVTALEDLKPDRGSMSTDIIKILRLSYDRLSDKRHQECMLYCALYPEDYSIERDLLVDQLIADGIVDKTRMHPMESGQAMLNHLVSVSLLTDTVDRKNAKSVKLHDLIRDMALQIMRENPTQFLAKAGEEVESIQAENWNDRVEKVSFMGNKISEISSSIEPPNCPMLSTLFLNQNRYLKSISRNFFQQMQGLNVLDLSDTDIVELPESVSLLSNLVVLSLRYCRYLMHVPDFSELSNLRRLDLSHTSIEEVPEGMEKLVKLTYLDLRNTLLKHVPNLSKLINLRRLDLSSTWIKEVPEGMEKLVKLTYLNLSNTELSSLPTGIFCNLTNLQYLSLLPIIIAEELGNHGNLKTLRCRFAEFNHFNASIRSLEGGSLTNFALTTKYYDVNYFRYRNRNNNVVFLSDATLSAESGDFPLSLPKNVELLRMTDCRVNVRSLCELTSIDNITNLKELHIRDCGDLMYLFYESQAIVPLLQRIETLWIFRLPCLREFVGVEREGVQPSLPTGSFSSLQRLDISCCGNIKKLFTMKNASFPNLEWISIEKCEELEEIVSTTAENEIVEGGAAAHATVHVVTLPKLKELTLWKLPKLQSIPFVADSLQYLWIRQCPNLKRIPFLDREPRHPSLQCISSDEGTWSSLEWNFLEDKDAYPRFVLLST